MREASLGQEVRVPLWESGSYPICLLVESPKL